MNLLSKSDKFVLLINLFCMQHVGRNWPSFTEDLGAQGILAAAFRIPSEAIPDDIEVAANDFAVHVTHLRHADMHKPEWLPFGVIDYRRWRRKEEWEALGYID